MNKVKMIAYNIIGFICVIAGIIGVFVPLWPTTVFAIVASIMFAKANPRMQAWLMKSKMLGPYLANYHKKTGIAMPYKIRTVWMMIAGMVFSVTRITLWWVIILLAVIATAVTIHIFVIKTREPYEHERMGFIYNITTIAICWVFLGGAIAMSHPATAMFNIVLSSIGVVLSLPVLIYAIKTKNRKSASFKAKEV